MKVRGRRVKDPLAVAVRACIALWVGVLLELLLEAVLTQGALPCVVPEVEGATEVAARGEARLTLVERRRYSAFVEGEEEDKPRLPLMIVMGLQVLS